MKSNLLLHNRNARLVLGEHVVGERSALDTGCLGALRSELQSLKRVADEPAGQQEEQGVIDDQVLLRPVQQVETRTLIVVYKSVNLVRAT